MRGETNAMSNQTNRACCGVPGTVPAGAMKLALVELHAPGGMRWRERVWLLRADGRDSLWAAVADCPERAVPVAASDSDGSLEQAGVRLLAGYLAETRAQVTAMLADSDILPAADLAAIAALRRDGWTCQ